MSTVNQITVSNTSEISVTTVGTQGVAGPNTILNRSVVASTVSTAGSLLIYDHTNLRWEDSQSTRSQSLIAKLYNLGFTSGGAVVTGVLDEDNMGSNSNTKLATQQSIKSYVDVQNAAQAVNYQGDTGGSQSVTINSEVLTIAGGTGIDTVGSSNTITVNIDNTVATLADTQTFTNKTLTSPIINTGDINNPDLDGGTIQGTAIDNSIIGANTPVAITGTAITATSLVIGSATITEAELEILDGATLSTTEINYLDGTLQGTVVASKVVAVDANKDVTGFRNITLTGELDAGSLDVSGNVDVDGVLEADAITVSGKALDEFVSDTVGAMISSNTESGITVVYQDSDNTIDFDVNDPVITLSGDVAGAATMTNLGDVTISTTIQANSIALGTDTVGNYIATVAAGEGIDVANSGTETAAITISAEDATSSNKGIASFDSTDFSVSSGAVTLVTERVQDIIGAMVSETDAGIAVTYDDTNGKLVFNTIDPTITLAGDLSGSITLTDLASGTLTATIVANSVALGTDTTGAYIATVAAGEGIDVSGSGAESATITISAEDATDSNKGVASFDSTDFAVSSGAVTIVPERIQDLVGAMFSGNTENGISVVYTDGDNNIDVDVNDFSITLTGDVTGSGTVTNLGNVSFAATIQPNSVALATDTTGNYVATIADAGNTHITVANSGSENAAVTLNIADDAIDTDQIANNAVTLGAKTAGNYVATIADAGNSAITVANSGTETAAVTLDIAASGVGTTEIENGAVTNAKIANNAVTLGTQSTGNYVATITGTANEVTVTGSGSETAGVTVGLPDDVTIGGDLVVTGDFTVNGDQVTLNTATLDVEDSTIRLAKGVTTLSATNNAGLEFGGSTSKPTILWNNSGAFLTSNKPFNVGGANGSTLSVGSLSLKNGGTKSRVDFYCEYSNAHYARLEAPAHSAFSGNVTITLPTTTGNLVGTGDTGTVSNGMLAGSIANNKLANSTVNFGGISLALGASDTTPAFNLSDATDYPTSSLAGTITNAQLAGSIVNAKLSNSSVSYGGVELALGATDATPAFNLSDATAYPTSSLVGTITNAQLAGSIANAKLSNSSVNYGGVTLSLGGSDTTPAFNLSDATAYPTSSLVGTITNAQLAGSIANGKLANSTITVSDGSNTTAIALGGTVTYAAGEGINVAESSGTITYSAELATETNAGVATFDGTDFTVSSGDVTLKAERIQDIVGAMVGSNTESGIAVTYEDGDGTLDFNVADPTITIDGDVDGNATMTNLGDTTITVALDNVNSNIGSFGSATAIPAITVNAKGLITAVSTSSISTSFTLTDGTTSQTIAGGNTLTVAGTANEVEVAVSATDTLTIGLPDNVTIAGNLTVTGTQTVTGSVVSNSNFTGLANANSANSTDFGFYGKYVESSATKYAGLFYDASTDNTFRLFTDTQTVPSTAVNIGATGYAAANLILNELVAVSLDVSGDVDVDGTLETDALTVDGKTIAELISDTVGAMVGSNTESGITVAYDDSDNTLDFTVGTLNQNTTGTAATATVATTVTVTANNSADETVFPIFVDGATGAQGAETDTGLTYNPSSGLLSATGFSGALTGTLQTAAQANVTSLGTLASLAVTGDVTINTNVLKVDTTNNRVGVRTANPSYSLDVGTATDAILIAKGTTAQRPTAAAGLFRYNTSLARFEGYTDAWGEIGGGGANTFVTDNFTAPNNSTRAYTLSQTPNSEDNLVVFVGGVFQNPNDFVASGTTLTLDEAPPSGTRIVVYSVRSAVSGNNLNNDQFTSTGSAGFTLSIAPVTENNTMVFVDGVYQQKTDYAVSGTTLTFDTAPTSGAIVEVATFTQTDINVPVNDTIATAHIKDANITVAKMAANSVDSNQYVDGSIDAAHLSANVISGLTEVTPVSGDKMMILDATDSALKKADVNEIMAAAVSITSAADAVAMSFDSSENATFTGNISSGAITVSGNVPTSSSLGEVLQFSQTDSAGGFLWSVNRADNAYKTMSYHAANHKFYKNASDLCLTIDSSSNATFAGTITSLGIQATGLNSSTSDWGNENIISRSVINAANRTYGGLILQDSAVNAAGVGFRYDGTGYKLELGTASSTSSGISTHLTVDRVGAVVLSNHLTAGGDILGAGVYVGSVNTSYDFYNNGTSYLNGAAIIDDNLTVNGNVAITNSSGDTLTLTKSTTEPSLRLEGDANKDFVFTVSGELLTLTQNDGATDILAFDHDSKEIRVNNQSLVKGSNSKYNMTFPDNGGIAMGAAYTYGNIYGSGGNVHIRANSYPANLGASSKVYFQTSNSSGGQANDVAIDNGNIVFGDGNGISFAADGHASGMANEFLDDYEEGAWTPTLAGSGGTSGVAYTTRQGAYTKIGNVVTANFHILLSNEGTLTGTTKISGLPFNGVSSPLYQTATLMVGNSALDKDQKLTGMQYAINAFIYLMIEESDVALSQASGNGAFKNNTEISGSVTYFTNS